MAEQKLSKTIRAASAVNLRYSADLLNLGRDYLKAFSTALTQPDDQETATPEPSTARPPLLLAGHAGETAHAAFAINGTANMDSDLIFRIDGDFADSKLSVEPKRIPAGLDGQQIVRISGKIGPKTETDKDYVGGVIIEGVEHRVTDFVLRKMMK